MRKNRHSRRKNKRRKRLNINEKKEKRGPLSLVVRKKHPLLTCPLNRGRKRPIKTFTYKFLEEAIARFLGEDLITIPRGRKKWRNILKKKGCRQRDCRHYSGKKGRKNPSRAR